MDVYFRDAQGAALSDTAALAGRRREILEDMKFLIDQHLSQIPPEQRPDDLYRPVGPPELSLDTASEIAIRALCFAVVDDPSKAQRAAKALLDRRLAGKSQPGDIPNALKDLDLREREKKEIGAMLVATPSLYECTVETRDLGNALLDRSAGLYVINESRNDTFKQGGFLTWDQLPLTEARRR